MECVPTHSMHVVTRVGLHWVKRGWMSPKNQTLTAVLLMGGVVHLTIERELQWRESQRERQSKIEVERAEGGEGRRVSDSGIRQLGQAAWLGADLIVYLSFPSHSGFLQRRRELLHQDQLLSTAASLIIFLPLMFIWFLFVKQILLITDTEDLLDSYFAFPQHFLFFFNLQWHCCRHGGLLEEEHPLSAVCLQEEGWVLTHMEEFW